MRPVFRLLFNEEKPALEHQSTLPRNLPIRYLLYNGMAIDEIAKITGLAAEEIEKF